MVKEFWRFVPDQGLAGRNVVSPGDVEWSYIRGTEVEYTESEAGVRSMQWVAGPVSQGEHQVKVQGRLGLQGWTEQSGTFALDEQTLTVLRSRM